MNFRVHFGFYVDVDNVKNENEARDVAQLFIAGDLVDSQLEGQRPIGAEFKIRQHLIDRARAWFQRAEPRAARPGRRTPQ